MTKNYKVVLTLNVNENVAKEAAQTVLMRANPHGQSLIDEILNKAGITEDALNRYFCQLGLVVSEFWNAGWDPAFKPTLRSHEVRNLYLPVLYSVIFSSLGNLKVGNYEYLLQASTSEGQKVDKKWLFDFSATLEQYRQYIRGDVGQIGNYGAKPQTSVMLSIVGEASARDAELLTRDGVTPDRDLAGIAVLAGLSLVETAYNILYTGVEQVNFRQLMGTVVERKPDKLPIDPES
jgi:hypothetical protein